jgi:23S rRNA (uracil1939-C5)-methyltransferase
MRLTVTRVGAQGDGVGALPDGGEVFLPFTLPGEVVEAELSGTRGRVSELIEASAERVAPPCPHFGSCGACSLQHWADAPYTAWKRRLLVEALARAGFPEAPVGELARTPPGARRRADLGLARGRDGMVEIGFHARGTTELVPLHRCLVLAPALVALMAPLAAALRALQALRRTGGAVVNLLDSGPDLLLRTDGELTLQDRQRLAAFAEAEGLARIAWQGPKGPAENAVQLRPVRHRLAGVELAPPPAAFLQASLEGEAAITAAVMAGLPAKLSPRARIADLHAGMGTLSIPLAARGVVQAFEGDAGAVAALARAHPRVTPQRRDLARQPLLPLELKSYDVVVLDPPFAGAPEQVAQLARSTVRRVVYVSCNPAALARDAATLRRAGYGVLAATPVDQFLWSAHLESVVVFAK